VLVMHHWCGCSLRRPLRWPCAVPLRVGVAPAPLCTWLCGVCAVAALRAQLNIVLTRAVCGCLRRVWCRVRRQQRNPVRWTARLCQAHPQRCVTWSRKVCALISIRNNVPMVVRSITPSLCRRRRVFVDPETRPCWEAMLVACCVSSHSQLSRSRWMCSISLVYDRLHVNRCGVVSCTVVLPQRRDTVHHDPIKQTASPATMLLLLRVCAQFLWLAAWRQSGGCIMRRRSEEQGVVIVLVCSAMTFDSICAVTHRR
jgi:hypothetical protein